MVSLVEQLHGLITAGLLIAAGLIAIGWTRNHLDTITLQRKLFLQAVVLRYLFGLAFYGFGLNATVIGFGDDAGAFHAEKYRDFLDQPENGLLALPSYFLNSFVGINRGYGPWVGLFSYLTRLSGLFTIVAISAFSGAMTVLLVYRLARTLFSETVATRAAYWAMFFPSLVLWSSLPLKEPVVILLEVGAMYACVRLRIDGLSARHGLLCVACLLMLLSMRFYVFYLEGAVVLASVLLFRAGGRGLSATQGVLVALALLVPLYFISGSLKAHMDFFEKRANLENAEKFRGDVSRASTVEATASGLQLDYELDTAQGFVMQAVVGAAHLLLAPFPWQLRLGSTRMLLTTPELMFWWYMFVAWIVPGVRVLFKTRLGDLLPIFLFMFLLGGVYSMTCGNIGIIFRQRAQFLPYFLIIGAYGSVRRREDPWGRSLWAPPPEAAWGTIEEHFAGGPPGMVGPVPNGPWGIPGPAVPTGPHRP